MKRPSRTPRRSAEKLDRDLRQQEFQAELDVRKEINRELSVHEQKAEQLMSRFNSLLDERQFRAAEEEADRARDILPNRIATAAGPLEARTRGYVYDMRDIVRRRHKGVVESLYSVEVATSRSPTRPRSSIPRPKNGC